MTLREAMDQDVDLKLSDPTRRYRVEPMHWAWLKLAVWAGIGWLLIWMFARAI